MDSQFWDQYEFLAQEASQRAHHIAMLVLQDRDAKIDAGLLLDYSHALSIFLGFLADHDFSDSSHAFVRTLSHGPVAVETDPDNSEVFRVYRFDRVELDPEDVTQSDRESILAAYGRMTSA